MSDEVKPKKDLDALQKLLIEAARDAAEKTERIKELEAAINNFLGAYEHGQQKHVKEAVEDLRRLLNE